MSWAELGEALGMTPPSAAERVRKLEEAGVIRGYVTQLDPQSLGLSLAAFIGVTLEHSKHRKAFLEFVARTVEVQECHHVAGESDYVLKVRCRDTAALERLISEQLKGLAGVAQTRTTIILSTNKESLALTLPEEAARSAKPAARKAKSKR